MTGVRRVARWVAWGTGAVVATATWGMPKAEAQTVGNATIAGPVLAAAAAEKVASRPDMVSAAVSARAQGSPVEVEDARTEFSTSWANPDGTVTVRDSLGQVRYRDTAGEWANVDLTLKTGADGVISASTPDGLVVASAGKDAAGAARSAGPATGETDVVTAGRGPDRQVVFGWGKGLGAPRVSKNVVTYPGASGVDVRIEATRDGFESFFDVKDAATLNSLVLVDGPAKVGWVLVSR